ncbi:MAG TPA: PIN domain protein [bacterium]|jgi:hypothetical protein
MRLYLDSTVIKGCGDPEFDCWSWSLIQDFRSGIYKPVISTLVQDELAAAPPAAREALSSLMACRPKVIEVTDKAQTLADLYLDRKILTECHRSDALHVALATLEEADMLVSWNYRNILHMSKLRQFITVNLELGLKPLQIRSPRVVASYYIMEPQPAAAARV